MKFKEKRNLLNSPVIIVTPKDLYKPYPKPKAKSARLYISPNDTDMKYLKLATIEVFSTFNTDKDKILGIITKEAVNIGADGVLNLKSKAEKKVISDFLTLNRSLMIPVKTYDQIMITTADAILFLEEN